MKKKREDRENDTEIAHIYDIPMRLEYSVKSVALHYDGQFNVIYQ